MSQKFQHSVQQRGEVSYVKLGGVLDEDNELGELVDKIPNGTAVIDLGEIERINSCGVRDWVNWLSRLEQKGTQSVLVECSPAIVAQINLVNNFTGSGVVKSFYVPYFCPECDEEKVLLVEASDMGPPPHNPPTCRCDECDLVMDFDDMPESYFAFLATQPKLTDPGMGMVRDLDRDPSQMLTGNTSRLRSRASHPNIRQLSSKPSFPSLPSVRPSSSRTGADALKNRPALATRGSKPSNSSVSSAPSQRQSPVSSQRASASSSQRLAAPSPRNSTPSMRMSAGSIMATPDRSNALVFTLVAVLLVAIAILAYLVVTK